jgi:Kdo2-lipid IVA lauroyltransferase/acyltransferase
VVARAVEARLGADVRLGGAWSPWQRLKNGLIYWLVRAGVGVAAHAPRGLVRGVVAALAFVAWALGASLRDRVARRLAVGVGRPSDPGEVRAAFAAVGEAIGSMATLFRSDERAEVALDLDDASSAAFRAALDEGRGVVYVTAHLGPWERMAALLVERGFPVATVARESYDPRLTSAVYERLRAPRGVRSIYRGESGAAIRVARELTRGGAVGFLIDLPSRAVPSLDVPLFGAPARVALGPARMALGLRAAVVVGTAARGRVVVRRLACDDLSPGEEGERALTRRIAAELDVRIRDTPTAWLGLFARQN